MEKKIKYRTLFMMIFIIAFFGIFFLYEVNSYIDSKLHNTLSYKKSFEVKLFNETLKHNTEMYTRRVDKILSDEGVTEAFSSQNRELLYTKTINQFKQFQKENKYIKIFTFRLADGTAFLRVHKPKMFGDSLNKNRKIIIDTNRDKNRKYGFEVGKLKMTYRVVTPIFKGKKYLGCVELGIEPERFMSIVNQIVPLKYALVVRNGVNDIMLHKIENIRSSSYILVKEDDFFQNILDKIAIYERKLINIGDKKFEVDANMVLKNHNNEVQAFFLTVSDITDEINQASNLKKVLAGTIVFSMILLVILLNYSLFKISLLLYLKPLHIFLHE